MYHLPFGRSGFYEAVSSVRLARVRSHASEGESLATAVEARFWKSQKAGTRRRLVPGRWEPFTHHYTQNADPAVKHLRPVCGCRHNPLLAEYEGPESHMLGAINLCR